MFTCLAAQDPPPGRPSQPLQKSRLPASACRDSLRWGLNKTHVSRPPVPICAAANFRCACWYAHGPMSRQAVSGKGDFCGGCDLQSGDGRAKRARGHACRSCLSVATKECSEFCGTVSRPQITAKSKRSADRHGMSLCRIPPDATRPHRPQATHHTGNGARRWRSARYRPTGRSSWPACC